MEYYKSYAAVKKTEGDLYILLWNNGQDLLMKKKIKLHIIYTLCYILCYKKEKYTRIDTYLYFQMKYKANICLKNKNSY